ncbi:MAG: nitroreductase family protein [Veillonella sp.]
MTPRKEQIDITKEQKLTPEQAELFLRSRRSIRNYQNKPVPAELIRKVLNVARMAPTATNTRYFLYCYSGQTKVASHCRSRS